MGDKDKSDGDKKTKIIGNYKIGKVLGTGSYGYVRLGVNIITGEQFAIKTLKDPQNKKGIQREISILKLLDHPNIVQLYDVIEDPKSGTYYLVLELASGGELFDYIVARGKLKEKEARKFFRQIISGVEYCHSNLVIHRDLKPENLLLDLDGNIKINDFGFSNVMTPGERFSTFCGSVSYVAPEIIRNIKYIGPEIDIWSLGVILYTLVCGRLPWPETSDGSPAITNIIEGDYDKTPLLNLSPACQDLIAKILIPDPQKRYTMQDIRGHAWVNEGYSEPPPCLVQEFPPIVNINPDILDQIVKIGFDEAEARMHLLSNAKCQEVTMYHLMLRKWNMKEQGMNPRTIEDFAILDDPPMSRRRVGSLPSRPPDFPASPDVPRQGTGAAARFHKKASNRMSQNITNGSSYNNGGHNQLEALAQALSDNSSNSGSTTTTVSISSGSASASSGDSGSPNGSAGMVTPPSPARIHQINTNAKRNTMEPQHYRSPLHQHVQTADAAVVRPPLGGPQSPPSPLRNNSPRDKSNRRSLIVTSFENFRHLIRADKTKEKGQKKEKPEKPEKPENSERPEKPEKPHRKRMSMLRPQDPSFHTPEPEVKTRQRSNTLETAWRSIVGADKVKHVSGVFNVDTTTTQSPQQVMEEIRRVLDIETNDVGDYKLEYKLKGYIFKCSYPHRRLKFQLEICRIKNLDLTGIKLKRMKGDLWVYKEYCQRVMAKMKL